MHYISYLMLCPADPADGATPLIPSRRYLLTTLHKVVLNIKDCVSPRIQVVPGNRDDLMQCLLIDESYLLQ